MVRHGQTILEPSRIRRRIINPEFLDARRNVDDPLRENAIEIAWKRVEKLAADRQIPLEALAFNLTSPNLCRLICLCRELQNLHGG